MKMKKSIALLVSLILVLSVTIGVSLAYLVATSDPVENIFNPSKVTTEVNETFDGNVKTNVSIKNTGDIDAYIRAAVVVTWQDAKGNIYGQLPVLGSDYTMELDLDNGWVSGSDGFYYWTSLVKPGVTTGVLIKSAAASTPAPAEGYTLCIEILGSGIQAKPFDGYTAAWAAAQG